MGEIVWVEQEDGNKRLAVELCFDLVKYRFWVVSVLRCTEPGSRPILTKSRNCWLSSQDTSSGVGRG